MRESKAKALGYTPLGYVKSWSYAAVDPGWQLLMAPVFAAPRALERAGLTLADMDLVDMHEAFAAQVALQHQGARVEVVRRGEAGAERGGRRDRSRRSSTSTAARSPSVTRSPPPAGGWSSRRSAS